MQRIVSLLQTNTVFKYRLIQRRLSFIILLVGFVQLLLAQNISVKSFRPLPEDLTARVDPVTNDNGQTCALVKIVTPERGFVFETDGLGMCSEVDESQTGEIWIWLSPGSRRITIKHKDLGVLRNYEYPVSIESGNTYEMLLMTGRITTVVEEQNRSNFLAITVSPPEAMVKIDGAVRTLSNGQLSTLLPVGEHNYELYCKLYHPKSGKFVIEPDKKTLLDLQLSPNFGFMSVSSNPTGAAVFIDGSNVGTTPFTSERLQSGNYTVQVAKDMYNDVTQQVLVSDNQTSKVTLSLAPNFAEPMFTCTDSEAEIWVNGEKKGTGRWSGRLPAGAYRVEARKASHRPTSRQITLETGNNTTVTLEAPSPIVGKVSVNSNPFSADILLDGKKVGTTPEILNHVLVGTHELRLEKTGCAPLTRTVIVEEGKTVELSEELVAGSSVIPIGQKVILLQKAVTDYDGNVYNAVQVGDQIWMVDNLCTTHYADGTSIQQGVRRTSTNGYYYYPDSKSFDRATHGLLYNWRAVMRNASSSNSIPSGVQGICPYGWHVPSDAEWTQLTNYVSSQSKYVCDNSSDNTNANIAKSLASATGWNGSNITCTVGNYAIENNATGFSAFPAGYYGGKYDDLGSNAYFWSTTDFADDYAYNRTISYDKAIVYRDSSGKGNGFSVRCVRN